MKNDRPGFLIVGGGLAGICIARRLWEQGLRFSLVDSGRNTGSRVAAGIINPLVFRRMTKSWRVDEALPVAVDFYRGLSREWGAEYFEEIPIRRAFAHKQEEDLWIAKQHMPDFSPYMKTLEAADYACDSVKNTFGTGVVLQAGFVRTVPFLEDARKWLKAEGVLVEEAFDHAQLDPETATYKGTEYQQVIFCEGYQAIYNPWFSYLPVQATKGEILTIASKEIPGDELLNRKCFILPVGAQTFKLGATYKWDSPNTEITDEGREEIMENARSLTPAAFSIVRQEAGVRPTVPDRRPLVGTHPDFPKLTIFNGLGAKGYMTAPLLSHEFVGYLKKEIFLSTEINIDRYIKLHQNK